MQKEASSQTQITFARNLGLFDATMLGVGAMIGAGIFVLTGLAAGVAGPAAILAFFLNGLVTLCTAFSYAELASAIPEAGGGYSYIKRAFPLWVGFLSGWMLWFAYTVACSLYALGFGSYFWEFFHRYTPHLSEQVQGLFTFWPNSHIALITVLIALAFLALNYKGSEVTGKTENVITVGKILILGLFIGFGLYQAYTHPDLVVSSFTPFFANGVGGVLVAMGLTFIAFEGYDLIATVSEEVQEPERNIPKAIFISLAITIVIYLLIIFVSIGALPSTGGLASWQILGQRGETAIVEAAQAFMPAFGVAVIVFGGLLSTTSALNATVLASSRVAFTMGRDRMLPAVLSSIHPRTRTPHIAITVSGLILLIIAVSFDITVVGSAASVMFLLTFTLVNLSVLALRRDRSIKRLFTIPFFPWPPIVGIITSLFLALYQFNLGDQGTRSLTVAAGWVVGGLFFYFLFFRREATKALPKELSPHPERALDIAPAEFRVLVPVYNPDNVPPLVGMACQLAKSHGDDGEVVVVSVVEVPQQTEIEQGLHFVSQRESVLRDAARIGYESGVRLRTEVRIAHKTAQAILRMARLEDADLLMLGWKGYSSTREAIFGGVVDEIVDNTPCDLLMMRPEPDLTPPFKRVLLPTAGGPSARFAARLVGNLLEEGGAVTLCSVTRDSDDEELRARARQGVADTMADIPFEIETERKLLTGESVPAAVIKEAKDDGYDVIMVGATEVSWLKQVMFGKIPERIARYSQTPVILAKHHQGAKTWVSRFLGRQ
jgi:amino acid transporter/nucleotide-binding universal stress UspA family protein